MGEMSRPQHYLMRQSQAWNNLSSHIRIHIKHPKMQSNSNMNDFHSEEQLLSELMFICPAEAYVPMHEDTHLSQ